MQNPESYFSICVTIWNDHKYAKLLRLADIGENGGKTGGRFLPFDEKSDFPYVKNISMNSKIAVPNELCIWEWWIDQYDSNRQFSRPVPETFYELVFLNNPDLNIGLLFPPLPFWELFDTLLDGFIVPLQHSKAFLLVINQTAIDYICLDISESSYRVDGNKIRIHENTPLKLYKIPKLDFFDTENYITNLGFPKYRLDPRLQRRIIYKRRKIWGDPIATLPLKRLNTHLAEYLKQIVTRLPNQTGNNEVIEAFIKSVTENVKPDSDLMAFIGNYYSQSHDESIVQTLGEHPLLESVFTSYSKKSSTDEKFLKVIIDHLPSLREKYLQILTDSYLEEEKRKLQSQLDPLQTQIDELNTELNEKKIQKEEIEAEIASSTDHQMKLLAQIIESEQRKQDLDELLNGKRTGLLQELTILNRVLQFGEATCETTPQNTTAPGLTIRPGKIQGKEDQEPEEILQLDDMYSILSDNLPEQGVDTPDVSELSKFISASYLHHLPLLCVGTSADEMARIISLSFKNQEPDTICVPTGYNNYSSLLSTIRSLKSDIVVLENMVGYCDEYCYTHLAKDIPEKYFIFLLEYEESLKLLPKGIFSHMGLINCDKFFTTLKSDEHLIPGKITDSISFPVDTDAKHSLLSKKLLTLTHGSPVSTGYVNSRVKILQGITQNEDNISEIIKVICTELISIIEIYGRSDEYIDELCTSTDPVIKDFKERLGVETE